MERIESLLAARSFLAPQLVGDRIFFISNLSGHLSLYAMDFGGSVPEPLLPPDIALQNPHLMEGYSYFVLPGIEKILVMIDDNGNEVYEPMLVPIDGGYPEPVFKEQLSDFRTHLSDCDPENNIVYFSTESQLEPLNESFQANLLTCEIRSIAKSEWGAHFAGASSDHKKVVLLDAYTAGDHAGYLWERQEPGLNLIFGTPLEDRQENQDVPINSIFETYFTPGNGLLFTTSLFEDNYGLGYLPFANPISIEKIIMTGIVHSGVGELEGIRQTTDNHYVIKFNIDGCSWLYEGIFDEDKRQMHLEVEICGGERLSNGVVEEYHYDKLSDRFILSFSTATSPTQIFTASGKDRDIIHQHTNERILGLSPALLYSGEDASYT